MSARTPTLLYGTTLKEPEGSCVHRPPLGCVFNYPSHRSMQERATMPEKLRTSLS